MKRLPVDTDRKKLMIKGEHVQFWMPREIHRILELKAIESGGKNSNTMARNIVEKALIHSDEKIKKQAEINNEIKLRRIEEKIDRLMLSFAYYLQSHFALHAEIPAEQREKIGEKAVARSNKFFEEVMRGDIQARGVTMERFLADWAEETGPSEKGR